jgi:hypothetical protein
MGSGQAPFSALPAIGAYAYRETLPIGYDFDGTWTIAMGNHAPSGEPVTDMCCALRFYFVKRSEPVPSAVARIWGVSKARPLGGSDGAFLGTYLGQVGFSLGVTKGLPPYEEPINIYKNVLLDDMYLASELQVHDERALQPPGIRVVSNARLGKGNSPYVLFDALGFDRIVVSLRFIASAGSNGLGFFWTTM